MELTSTRVHEERTIFLDYLRVFSTFAVMILHISAQNFRVADVNSFAWQTFNVYDSMVRWAVPVFVMISGSLFLNRDISTKQLYSKYILRLTVSFLFWSLLYSFIKGGSVLSRLSAIVHGHYHMWFILMMIGLYMCIPIIKPIVQSDYIAKYYLLLSFVFTFAVPELLCLTDDFGPEFIAKSAHSIYSSITTMNMHIVMGYVSYYILGYYLFKTELIRKQRIGIYVLGLFGLAVTIALDSAVALKTQQPCTNYYGNFNVNVLLMAIAVFTLFKYGVFQNNTINNIMRKLSKYSFGAYLIHAMVIDLLNNYFGINTLSFNPVVSVIVLGLFVFIVSFCASALLNQVPIIKKYFV